MEPKRRAALAVAFCRLNAAHRRYDLIDKTIEVAVSLESIFADSSGGEARYKLGTKSALLLGDTMEARRQVRKDIMKFYEIRGRVVHGGGSHLTEEQSNAILEAVRLCERSLRKIVEIGGLPDWINIELGDLSALEPPI
jgi:hypothetical protein